MNKWLRILVDREFLFDILVSRNYLFWMSDEEILKKMYRNRMKKDLNLEVPCTYTEKLQWLKLYDRRPEYTTMVDKYRARVFIAERIGAEYTVPLLGMWENFDDIDFEGFPDKFVLKCNHDSGGLVICKDKRTFDIASAKRKIEKTLRRNYYYVSREWPYKNLKPCIIAEPYMEDCATGELRDYKFFTFGGEPKVMYIAQGRNKGKQTAADFFDMDFNHLPLTIDHDMAENPPEKPVNFELMKKLAAELSYGTPQLRVDFYEVNGRVYVGEMTFFHCTGMAAFHPEHWDTIFGEWVVLPEMRK